MNHIQRVASCQDITIPATHTIKLSSAMAEEELDKDLDKKIRDFQANQVQIEENAKKLRDQINKNYKDLDSYLNKLRAQEKELKVLKSIALPGLSDNHPYRASITEAAKSCQRIRDALVPRTGRYA